MSKDILFNANSKRYDWLHPWYPAPFYHEQQLYRAAMQFYALQCVESGTTAHDKILHHYDPQKWLYFMSAKGAGDARLVLDRDDELNAMKLANRLKFSGNPLLARFLLETGKRELIYDAPWDDVFGTGKDGSGENQLGQILMEIRQAIRDKPSRVKTFEF